MLKLFDPAASPTSCPAHPDIGLLTQPRKTPSDPGVISVRLIVPVGAQS